MVVRLAQSKYSPSVGAVCSVQLLLQVTWLSRHMKLILSARNTFSEVEKLAKGKSSINKEIVVLIYCKQLFNIILEVL